MSSTFISFQDFEAFNGKTEKFISKAINWHKSTAAYRTALDAELYDRQLNPFINNFTRKMLSAMGTKIDDPSSTFRPIASNYFHELNLERNMYSLGNGLTFNDAETKRKLGIDPDEMIQQAGLTALEQGSAFVFYNLDRCYVFPLTHFVPLKDERTGALRAGIRFWKIADDKPTYAVLYEEDGFTRFFAEPGGSFERETEKEAYKTKVNVTTALGEQVEGYENYGALPIVPLYADKDAQSTLVGMRQAIDNYDLIQSGFADNVANCQQIYWIINNAGGMDDEDIATVRQNLLYRKMAVADGADGTSITPYTTPVPTDAHEAALTSLHYRIYRDFGAVDVSNISARAKTATEITAAYLPMDLRADAFEYQIIQCVTGLLALAGVEGVDAIPSFKRNKVANEADQTQMILSASTYLDDETVLAKLPFITPDEVEEILRRKDAEEADRYKLDDGEEGATTGGTSVRGE